jgi:hypothetical protein
VRAVCRAQSFLRSSRDPDSPSPPYREVLPGLATLPGSMLIAILVAVSEERAAVRQVEAAFWQGPTAAEALIFDCRSRRRNTELSLPPHDLGRTASVHKIYPNSGLSDFWASLACEFRTATSFELPFPRVYDRALEQRVRARKAARVTQASLAETLGRPQSFVAKYESGERRLDVAEFVGIARAIGADPLKLLKATEMEQS